LPAKAILGIQGATTTTPAGAVVLDGGDVIATSTSFPVDSCLLHIQGMKMICTTLPLELLRAQTARCDSRAEMVMMGRDRARAYWEAAMIHSWQRLVATTNVLAPVRREVSTSAQQVNCSSKLKVMLP
jgi:hypothetical protein